MRGGASEPEPKQPLPLPLGGDLHQLDPLHGAVLAIPGILPERIERLAGFLQGGELTHGHLAPGIVGVEAEGHRPCTRGSLGSFCRTALQPTKKPLPKQGLGTRQAWAQARTASGGTAGLDAAAEFAAEAEGGAGTQDGQGARGLPESVGVVIKLAALIY